MKERKANKKHRCDCCNGSIKKADVYEYKKIFHRWFDEDEWKHKLHVQIYKECKKCIVNRAKYEYKIEQHNIRAEKRRKNCPDAKFEYVWQGGWAGGVPDGGDQELECHACNLHCT